MSLEAKRDKLFFGDIVDSNKQSQEGNNPLIN